MAAQKMTKTLNSLQGKTMDYAHRTSKTMKNKSSQNVVFPTSQKHPALEEGLGLFLHFQRDHRSSPSPIKKPQPQCTWGKLVRAPAALNHPSAFCLFLLHSCVQFSVLGVFKGTFILGPGFSSFMVIQLPLPEPKNV